MTNHEKRVLLLIICTAALLARFLWPAGAETAARALFGPVGNPVAQTFAALDGAFSGGTGGAVPVFKEDGHVFP